MAMKSVSTLAVFAILFLVIVGKLTNFIDISHVVFKVCVCV